MKIYLNKRDMKQLEKILGLGWTELKEDFFWALEVGMKSWKCFGLKSWTRWGWIGQHVFAGKKKKRAAELKEEKRWNKRKRKGRRWRAETEEREGWNWKAEVLKLKDRGWTGRIETRYIFSIYFPSNLLRKTMVNSFMLNLIFSMN